MTLQILIDYKRIKVNLKSEKETEHFLSPELQFLTKYGY